MHISYHYSTSLIILCKVGDVHECCHVQGLEGARSVVMIGEAELSTSVTSHTRHTATQVLQKIIVVKGLQSCTMDDHVSPRLPRCVGRNSNIEKHFMFLTERFAFVFL